MTQTETEIPHKKEAGIGWGGVLAFATIAASIVAAVTGLGHVFQQPIPNISGNAIDSVFEMQKEMLTHEQWIAKGKAAANAVGGAVNGVIDGAENIRKHGGNSLAGLGSTLFGNGSIDEARSVIAETFVQLPKEELNSQQVQDFIAGNQRAIFYGKDGGLLLKKGGEVLYASGDKLKEINSKVLGGLLPGGKQIIEGFNPNAYAEVQRATEEGKDVIGKIGRNAVTAGLVAGTVGLALKASETTNYAASVRANRLPSTRVTTGDLEHIKLALNAHDVNRTFANF
jgi:hypothetical protein